MAGALTWQLTESTKTNSHEYQKLPLVPIEEFLAKHPEHAHVDENALMVARIEDERAEREGLEQQRQELLKRKQKLIAENKKRREDLANLDNDLEKFIDVSSPCVFFFSDAELTQGTAGGEADPEDVRKGCLSNSRLADHRIQYLGRKCTTFLARRMLSMQKGRCRGSYRKAVRSIPLHCAFPKWKSHHSAGSNDVGHS